ncbi:MAG: ligase-associated DNA damage response exonuclease [Pseudomonadota bacterium]
MTSPNPILHPTDAGLYCPAGDFYVDPVRPVSRAVITHGHADHARAGHGAVLATAETLAIMAARYGEDFTEARQAARYGEAVRIKDAEVALRPAGHVLGSAQAQVEAEGTRIIVSGDYKRRRDPTCAAFEPAPCDVFISEATFALPVFRHPDDAAEIAKLLASLKAQPERTHLVGAYALGKAQRVIALLREAGYDKTIYLHGAQVKLCELYEQLGVKLGPLEPVGRKTKAEMAGEIVLCPPSALNDRWSRRLNDPLTVFASGWMRVRARARQRGVELPLILSDHADWDELTRTVEDIRPGALWITHGREEALARWAELNGVPAKPLSLVGYEDEHD